MSPDETKLLHAYLDGELDPAGTLELETRMTENPQLRSAYERLREMSAAIREKADYHAAPARLRFSPPDSRQPKVLPARWLKQGAALAAAIVLGIGIGMFVLRPPEDDAVARELVASHVRATLSGRLIDVASSDQHTVKPWLSAHLPFSPPVGDFSGEGFTLTGARVDYVAGNPAAVLVYKRRQHTIDLFAFAGKPPAHAAYARDGFNGFNVERFGAAGMTFWAVSDLNRNELEDFARLVAAR
jgi:anti-sigma factor RsiW